MILAFCRLPSVKRSISSLDQKFFIYALALVTIEKEAKKRSKHPFEERLGALVHTPMNFPAEKMKRLNELEQKAISKYLEHQRRVWGELDPASLTKLQSQENEISSLLDMLSSLKGQINDEHETQEKLLRDLRNSLSGSSAAK